MKKFLIVAMALGASAAAFAQSPSPSPNDVEALRQQVQALTETVQTLQQQVKRTAANAGQNECRADHFAGQRNRHGHNHAGACARGKRAPAFPDER
ncbi:MAG: hypothetical protein H0T83_06050 [Chthoniobacterales bacterium]|nr:hypothetical protein [Chthoniobacterales bacterium]